MAFDSGRASKADREGGRGGKGNRTPGMLKVMNRSVHYFVGSRYKQTSE